MSINPRANLEIGESPYDRNNKNKLIILSWLAKWRCSTDRVLLRCCGIKTRSGLKLLNSLESDGLIRKISPSPIPFFNLYMLTALGVQQGVFIGLDFVDAYDCNPTHLPQRRLMHDLVVQDAVLDYLNEHNLRPNQVLPECCFQGDFGDAEKRPDAIIDGALAVELELTQKSSDRIFMAFVAALQSMNAGLFREVHYFFTHQRIHDLYLNKYSESEWPVYKFEDKSRKRPVDTGSIIKIGSFPQYANKFHFHIAKPKLSFTKTLNII